MKPGGGQWCGGVIIGLSVAADHMWRSAALDLVPILYSNYFARSGYDLETIRSVCKQSVRVLV